MKKLNPEFKAKWVAALRSGNYKQGYGQLCKLGPGGSKVFCCIGVAADLVGPDDWIGRDMGSPQWRHYLGRLPKDTLEEIDLPEYVQGYLIRLNDGRRVDFGGIADYIEQNL